MACRAGGYVAAGLPTMGTRNWPGTGAASAEPAGGDPTWAVRRWLEFWLSELETRPRPSTAGLPVGGAPPSGPAARHVPAVQAADRNCAVGDRRHRPSGTCAAAG